MAYIKNNWVDREGTTRYFETVDSDGAKIFTPDYTQVTELGTPVNADNMNHIEEGIAAGSFTKFDLNTTYGKNDLVTVIEDGSPVIYKSLVDNNIGNALSSSIAWEKISLGGGGGLEIGDIGFTQMAIDESKGKRRILNGQVIIQDQYVQFTNIIKNSVTLNPDLACTEAEWQTAITMSTNGVCKKFVIDDNAGIIRLPKYPSYFIAGLTGTAPVVGNGIALGLSNGEVGLGLGQPHGGSTSRLYLSAITDYYGLGVATAGPDVNHSTHGVMGLTSDPTKSGVIAQLSNDQAEKIKGTYFIQVATGAETEDNIINEIELNNPYSLGDSKYSPVELNNISWLKSEGQWNSKAVYPSYYDWALTNFNNGVEGFALSTGEYTDYDVVINPAEETFRLPLLDGSESLPSDRYIDLTLNASDSTYTAPANGWYSIACMGRQVRLWNSVVGNSGGEASNDIAQMVSTPAKKGQQVILQYVSCSISSAWSYFRFTYAQGNGSLYFYVGETVQNAHLINAGRIEEKLTDKADRSELTPLKISYITQTYVNGTSGYRIWSDKYCEQWGVAPGGSALVVSLLKAYRDTNYNIQLTGIKDSDEGAYTPYAYPATMGTFTIYGSSNITKREKYWITKGYIA